MRFVSLASTLIDTDDALAEIVEQAGDVGGPVTLACVFFTGHHVDGAERIVSVIQDRFGPRVLLGCSGESVVGDGREIEESPGLTVLIGSMPGVMAMPLRIGAEDWQALNEDRDALLEQLCCDEKTAAIIALADPWTTPIELVMGTVNQRTRRGPRNEAVPIIGGVASAARSVNGNRLIVDEQVFHDGFVGVALSGAIDVEPVVSQGCRPLWAPMLVTKGQDNVIAELGGRNALQHLRSLIESMNEVERQQLNRGIMVGTAVSEYRETFGLGDFLMRGIVGVDEIKGQIGVGGRVRVGQTVQFHVRDAMTAHEDLLAHLQVSRDTLGPASGALLFTCNGRGSRMFDEPGHDVAALEHIHPEIASAGFFAGGEFGPVDGQNFVHGFTASIALMRPKA